MFLCFLDRAKEQWESGERDDAGKQLLEWLFALRAFIVQDFAIMIMMKEFKGMPIWSRNPVFQSSEFLSFAEALRNASKTFKAPADEILSKAMPSLNAKLDVISASLMQQQLVITTELQKLNGNSGENSVKLGGKFAVI
jgi:hypothetical protein